MKNKKLSVLFAWAVLLAGCQLREQPQYLTFIKDTEIEYDKNFNFCSLVEEADGYGKDEFTFHENSIELPNGRTVMCNTDKKENSIGSMKIAFMYRNVEQMISIKFIDTTAPVFTDLKKEYVVQKDNEYFQLNQLIHATDNYDSTVPIYFNGAYDLHTVGEYPIEVIAEDSNKNSSKAATVVIVQDNSDKVVSSSPESPATDEDEKDTVKNTPGSSTGNMKKESKKFDIDDYEDFNACLAACNKYISGSNAICTPYPQEEQIKQGYIAIFQ